MIAPPKYLVLGLGSPTIGSFTHFQAKASPNIRFLPRRLLLDDAIASSVLIISISIGDKRQFLNDLGVPGSLFRDLDLELDVCEAHCPITVHVLSRSSNSTLMFQGAILGLKIPERSTAGNCEKCGGGYTHKTGCPEISVLK